jgi:hypothetical protein
MHGAAPLRVAGVCGALNKATALVSIKIDHFLVRSYRIQQWPSLSAAFGTQTQD